jgi:hypothetical protein
MLPYPPYFFSNMHLRADKLDVSVAAGTLFEVALNVLAAEEGLATEVSGIVVVVVVVVVFRRECHVQ